MKTPAWTLGHLILVILAWPAFSEAHAGSPAAVEFNRDIRPILSNHCFVCHGPDNNLRKADLRLDREKDAFEDRGGYTVLVPGKPQDSELYRRITSTVPAKRMPPAKGHKQLSKQQIDLIRVWIEQGAKYQNHWSLIAVQAPAAPQVKQPGIRNPIDSFILDRLHREKLQPSGQADRVTLMRRLSFDLIGLPPTPAEVDAFVNDASPDAYENLVDRLLASEHFGERLALYWLDLVRYADTGGYHSDNHRDVWLYRDYVIESFNQNKPFDRFTIEQLAGDLLPDPTLKARIASGYNRLLQTTEEGGAQAKEYQAKYYADRVRNVSTVWLGLTLGCSECHDHKFDPFTTKEFYQLEAFFADLSEKSVGRQEQTPIMAPDIEAKLRKLNEQIEPLQKQQATIGQELARRQPKWEKGILASGTTNLPTEIAAALAVDPAKRNTKQKDALTAYQRGLDPAYVSLQKKLDPLLTQKAELLKTVPTTLVSIAMAPRPIRVLPRGNWLDDSGEIVQPGLPASLPKLEIGKRRATRLDLAQWLVTAENPLTARVFVNRLWALYFGQGIVKTMDDFGAQGAWPSHPELLDWLAAEFHKSGWDVKHMIKLMVTSNTYRQISKTSPLLKQRDPYNQWLARQTPLRLDAEMVRDNALAVSGLLVRKIGGPSVKPYQPAGYWTYLNFPKRDWTKDSGENQYRRGLYTYWQRTFLHPSMLAFDASTREECVVDRTRSNTPQQALVLLNDPTYVEAARAFAERILREGGKDSEGRIHFAFRWAMGRKARAEEVKILEGLAHKHLEEYQQDPKAAEAYLRVGDRLAPKDIPAPELAAWTNVGRAILNLHETITRN